MRWNCCKGCKFDGNCENQQRDTPCANVLDYENEEDLSWTELVDWAKINGLKTGEFNKGLLILKDYETGHTWNFYTEGFVTLTRNTHCIDLAVEVTNFRTNRQMQYFIKGLLR